MYEAKELGETVMEKIIKANSRYRNSEILMGATIPPFTSSDHLGFDFRLSDPSRSSWSWDWLRCPARYPGSKWGITRGDTSDPGKGKSWYATGEQIISILQAGKRVTCGEVITRDAKWAGIVGDLFDSVHRGGRPVWEDQDE